MTYLDFQADILTRAHAARAFGASHAIPDQAKTNKVIAACALVIAAKGQEWCRTNPKGFADEVKSNLGMWVNIALTIAGFLIPGGAMWLGILKWIVPTVLSYLNSAHSFTAMGMRDDYATDYATDDDFAAFQSTAEYCLNS